MLDLTSCVKMFRQKLTHNTYFAAADEKGPEETGDFLTDYSVSRYNGRPLTDFDENSKATCNVSNYQNKTSR
jgi:hypothetical protein